MTTCIKCGHQGFIDVISMLCEECKAEDEWRRHSACKRCYINERDPRSIERLCLSCENSIKKSDV